MGRLCRRVAAALDRRRPTVRALLAAHLHAWDICRNHGQYRYRICLNGCDERRPC